jgi:hypothetical protein
MKMSTWIDQFSYAEKLAALTQLYLELRLPLAHALRAAEADLSQRENRVRFIRSGPIPRGSVAIEPEPKDVDVRNASSESFCSLDLIARSSRLFQRFWDYYFP